MFNKNLKKISAFMLAVFMLAFIFSGCDVVDEFIDLPEEPYEADGKAYVDGEEVEVSLPDKDNGHYSQLSDDQKYIYAVALKAAEMGENSITFDGVDYEEYLDIYADALTAVIYDHPEFFWLSGTVEAGSEYIVGSEEGKVNIILHDYEYWDKSSLKKAKKAFDEETEKIVSAASKLEDDYEKVKYVHDVLADRVYYDFDSYNAGDNIDPESDAFVNTAYGSIVEGRAMCGGYARGFGHILHELGIESHFIRGEADGGPHAWNVIELGGELYHIDLTWDDQDGEPFEIVYNYFGLTDDEMYKSHTPDKDHRFLSSDAVEYNYFVRESLYLDEYSFDAVNGLFEKYNGKGIFSFKCANEDVMNDAADDLIDKDKFYEIKGMENVSSCSYLIDEELYIFTFVLE